MKISSTQVFLTATTTSTAAVPISAAPVDATTTSSLPTLSTSRDAILPSAVKSHHQWSRSARGRHRNAVNCRRSSQASATEEISLLAKLQSEYYKRKLEIKEEQHVLYVKEQEKKMRVLELQEQYYAAKLRKLAEE